MSEENFTNNASAPEAPAPSAQVVNSQAATTPPNFDFNSFFPEDVRNDPDFQRISKNLPVDQAALAKDYYHKAKHFGRAKELAMSEIEKQSFEPDQYSYELPEDYKVEDSILESAKAKAHALGIKPEAFKELFKDVFNADREIALNLEKQQREAAELEINNLRKEWSFDFDKRLEAAEKTLSRLIPASEDEAYQQLPQMAKIYLLKAMDKVARITSEGSIRNDKPAAPMSEGDFRAKIQQIQGGLEPESIKQAKIAELYQQFYSNN